MKKLLVILLAFALCFSLAACGGGGGSPEPAPEPVTDEEEEFEPEEIGADEPANDPDQGGYVGGTFNNSIGSFSITTEWIPLDTPLLIEDDFSNGIEIAYANGSYYLHKSDRSEPSILGEYDLTGDLLVFSKKINLPGLKYEDLCADDKGVLYLSGFSAKLCAIKDGAVIFEDKGLSGPKHLSMHPSGEWGISWYSSISTGRNNIVKLVGDSEIEDGAALEVSDLKTVLECSVTKNNIFLFGMKDSKTIIRVFDTGGNVKYDMGDGDRAWDGVTVAEGRVVETNNGFITVNKFGSLVFFDTNGYLIGEIKASDLFGTPSSHSRSLMRSAQLLDDGSIILSVAVPRDGSGSEVAVYRLTGF